MSNNKIKCELCGKEFSSYKGIAKHISHTHKVITQDYYNKYIKQSEDEGKCKMCSKPTTFAGLKLGYKTYCSSKCTNADPVIREQINNTNLERYGATCSVQGKEIKKKAKKTILERYGVEHNFQSDEFKKKRRETMEERYGVEYPLQNKDILERTKKTNLEKYGTEFASQSELVKEKMKETNLERYGVPYILQVPEIREKIKETNIERYGAENPGQSEVIKAKVRNTNLRKYGSVCSLHGVKIKEKVEKTHLKRYGVHNITYKHMTNYEDWLNLEKFLEEHNQEFTCLELATYFNANYYATRKVIRSKQLEYLVKDFYSLSESEQVFAKELDNLDIKYEIHNREIIKPSEVDFYLPKYKLAIEISPSWTHKHITNTQVEQKYYGQSDPEYHYNKFKLCKEQGIELITIFDWTDQSKVLNFIKSKTLATETIYARKTTTKLVQGLTKEHKDFLDRNHILGSINNSKTTEVVELYYDNKVIGLAVFEAKKNYTELRRLAFEQGYRVQGGASKLIKTFTREHSELKELITFSDNDLGTGHVYEKLGFQILEENQGTLIWYNEQYDKKIPNLSLVKQGTDRLLKNFPGYEYVGQGDDLPSNQEIIQQYGFVPVYDCGYTKWSLTL